MKKLVLVVVFSILLVSGREVGFNKGLKMEHDCSQRTGPTLDAPDTAYLLWKSEIPHTHLVTSPVGTPERIIQLASSGLLVCFDENGNEVWKFAEGMCVIPVDNKVIVSWGSDLRCFNLEDGSPVWRTETTIASGSPVLSEGSVCYAPITPDMILVNPIWPGILDRLHRLLFGCEECQIMCHDIQTGEKTWILHEDDEIYSITYDQGQFIVLLKDGRIYSLNKNTKEMTWQFKSREKANGYPVLHCHQVMFTGDSHIFCVDIETGHLFWKFPILKGSSPTLAYDRVFVNSQDGYLYCIDEYTGELLWRVSIWHDPPSEFWNNISLSSPVIADEKVFVGSSDTNVYAFTIDDGSLVWKYTLGGPVVVSPAITGDKILVPSTDGFLYAFGIDPETYFQKAQRYMEQQEYEKSQKYFYKAREWYSEKGDLQKVALCEELIEIIAEEIQEYSLISESIDLAEEYFDKGNESLLQKKYDDALEYFYLSKQLYESIGYEKRVAECCLRIEYIQGRPLEEENFNSLLICCSSIVVILACIIIVLLKEKGKSKK